MMFSQFIFRAIRHGRRFDTLALCGIALVVAACSSSTTATPTPNPLMRGQWTAPVFADLTTPLGALAFADGNQQVGYACTAVASPNASAAPTATSAATPTPMPTLAIPGKPTSPPTLNDLQNAFWRTTDGGETWRPATLPANPTNLLCPVSAIVASDVGNPDDVFFLAATGSLNLAQPTSILPGQLQYQLWRSQDGAQTWQQLTVPIAPNPLTPAIIEPYHLVIVAKGQQLALASNQSGADVLFTSDDGGKAWTQRLAPTAATGATAGTYTFAGFAAGSNAALDALVMNAAPGAATPYALWQSDDNAGTWHAVGALTFAPTPGAGALTQIFAAPGGRVLYALAHADSTTGAAQTTTTVSRSTDGGANWTALGWPAAQANANTPPGAGDIAALGANFAIDATGDAFIAPPVSDTPLPQDPNAQNSAGFFEAAAGASAWKIVAQPKAAGALAIGLAVSAVTNPTGTTTPTLAPIATETATPLATSTAISATGTPGAVSTAAITPAATISAPTNGLPTLWTNFGPLTQLGQQPSNVGLFLNVLP